MGRPGPAALPPLGQLTDPALGQLANSGAA
jgi:hypothetical protein